MRDHDDFSTVFQLTPLAIAIGMAFGAHAPGAGAVSCDGDGIGRYTVNSNADTDDGDIGNGVTTLREAVADIQVSGCNAYDVIFDAALDGQTLTAGSSYGTLGTPGTESTISAPAGVAVTLTPAATNFGLFTVNEDSSATLRNLTIDNAATGPGPGDTVAVLALSSSGAVLAIVDSVIKNRNGYHSVVRATDSLSSIEVVNSTFDNNHSHEGGAIYAAGDLTIVDSVFTGNSAAVNESTGNGGAIFFDNAAGGGNVDIRNSVFTGNTSFASLATEGRGGAFAASSSGNCTISISNSTFSGNGSNRDGGAISIDTAATCTNTLTQVTVSGNTAGQNGGGIVVDDQIVGGAGQRLAIRHSTVTGNGAANGGGIAAGAGEVNINTVDCSHSIVADNTATGGGDNLDGLDGFADDFCFTVDGAMLEPLADNGGTGQTHFPMTGSPVIDAGDPAVSGQPALDQRGGLRINDGGNGPAIDIGAVEFGPKLPPAASAIDDLQATVGDDVATDISGNFSDPADSELTFSQAGLPANFTLAPDGRLSGTVSQQNFDNGPQYAVTVSASNGSYSVDEVLNILIAAAPVVADPDADDDDDDDDDNGLGLGPWLLGLLGWLALARRRRRG